jgi:hypothetical protein
MGFGLIETELTGTVTVIEQVSVFWPSAVVTVMTAVPGPLAVTTPTDETVATAELLDDHKTALFVASVGNTVAASVCVAFKTMLALFGATLTLWTPMVLLTVTVQVLNKPGLSAGVAVIIALPAAWAVTFPVESTVATPGVPEVHVMSWLVAFVGVKAGVSCCTPWMEREAVAGVMLKAVIAIAVAVTVTVQVAVFPPSVVDT